MTRYFLDRESIVALDEETNEIRFLEELTGPEEEDEEDEAPAPPKKRTYKKRRGKTGPRICKICGGSGHNKKTCPENPDREPLRARDSERPPSDEEAAEDRTTKTEDIEFRIKQGMDPHDIARECDATVGTVYSIKSRMKRRGEISDVIEPHDPDDLSDLKDPEEL